MPHPATPHHQTSATAIGLVAIAAWGTLAALTQASGGLPPFQLAAFGFAIGTLAGLVWARFTQQSLATLRTLPLTAWALGLYGLLGYHAVYFLALRTAPAIEANLINYLWPLLIVLFAGAFPNALKGQPLGPPQLLGAALGCLGTALIVGRGATFSGSFAGYLPAFAAALIWSSYSVLSRRQADVPTVAVVGYCGAAAVGALLGHFAFETTVTPATLNHWLAILALGIGPMGIAFYAWDVGMKHGNITLLGAASFATPVISTLVIAMAGLGTLTYTVAIAAFLITLGAILAARPSKPTVTP